MPQASLLSKLTVKVVPATSYEYLGATPPHEAIRSPLEAAPAGSDRDIPEQWAYMRE